VAKRLIDVYFALFKVTGIEVNKFNISLWSS